MTVIEEGSRPAVIEMLFHNQRLGLAVGSRLSAVSHRTWGGGSAVSSDVTASLGTVVLKCLPGSCCGIVIVGKPKAACHGFSICFMPAL